MRIRIPILNHQGCSSLCPMLGSGDGDGDVVGCGGDEAGL
jgi:hypothetical protein